MQALTREPLSAGETALVRAELAALAHDLRRLAGFCSSCQATAGAERKLKKCQECRVVKYCDRECQGAGWAVHKLACKVLAADCDISEASLVFDPALLLPLQWTR